MDVDSGTDDADVTSELPLPSNPNCVSFAADAIDILARRSWADVQRMAVRIATPFHDASALPVLVGMGWRVALDRKNQRHTQVTTYFVFDGPATSSHLDALDAAMDAEPELYAAGSIERVPSNGVNAALLHGGTPFLPMARDSEGLWCRRLELSEGHVRPARVDANRASSDHLAGELRQILGVRAPYGDAERETERMRLAFARHFSTRIVEADGVVREGEEEFMNSVFPAELIASLGLDGPAAQGEYLQAAQACLAGRLGHHDKLALIGLFFSACYADGSLDAREMRVLKEAGECLGLTREEVVKYLRRFW
ncbi:MAG: TerB family tellurite resistance protein [Myxococcales bacterium]|nr:TerB family tellurite resistance protein [Myxococcales bacterium]